MKTTFEAGNTIAMLDHGYCKFIESWGSDQGIIETARTSTDKGFLGWEPGICPICNGVKEVMPPSGDAWVECHSCTGKGTHIGDKRLLKYLWDNLHATPFEFAGMTVEIQAPIFVFREWHRHRTQSYNEMSARYVPLPDLNYIPSIPRLLLNSSTNKQASSLNDIILTPDDAHLYRQALIEHYKSDEEFYQRALKMGVPKELARIHLPVGRYSKMRATGNLRNWLSFLTLRRSPKAQSEIREYAQYGVGYFISELFPRTWSNYVGEAV